MHRYYVSEMDERAEKIARRCGIGLELICFCSPENMEDKDAVEAVRRRVGDLSLLSLHAPYYELAPCAIDPLIRAVCAHRLRQGVETCRKLGISRMVAHSGYGPQVYFPQWFVPKSIDFWRAFAAELPAGFELMVENVLDARPEYLRDVCDGVGDPRIRICLDVGHVNAYSEVPVEEWIRTLGNRIGHVHLHNNDGSRDAHRSVCDGSMDAGRILALLEEHAPDAGICIESVDAARSMEELKELGRIHRDV